MSRSDIRASVLAGLVSAEAAEAYDRLLTAGRMLIGRESDELDLDEPAACELFEAGLLNVSVDGTIRPVPPAVALRLTLNRNHRRLLDLQQELAQGWSRFARLAFSNGKLGPSAAEDVGEVRLLSEPTEIALLAAGLYRDASKILRSTITRGAAPQGIHDASVRLSESVAVEVEFRILHEEADASTSSGQSSGGRATSRVGDHCRIYHTVPLRMVHVDDDIALVIMEQGALLVQSEVVVAMLGQWFDQLWKVAASDVANQSVAPELSPMRRVVLSLLVSGLSDEMIAQRTGTAVRTVRRHVKGILDMFHVDTRFAAGVAAAKRGWV